MDFQTKKNFLINFYEEYLFLEDLNNAKINPKNISESLYIRFDKIKENQNKLSLTLSENQIEEIKQKYPIKLDANNKDINNIKLFFPIIKVLEKNGKSNKEFLYPLFSVDITKFKKEFYDKKEFEIPLSLISTNDYQPIYNTFQKFLGIEEDAFSENVPFSYLLNNIMRTKFDSTKNILESFNKFLKSRLYFGELYSHFGLITKLDISYLSKNLKYELNIIKQTDISQIKLIEEYLFKEHDYSKSRPTFKEDNCSVWYGSFSKYPLSKGQATVLQEMNSNIISVIGAPGTGKTTLFLDVISTQIVKRALSNIQDKKDIKNLIYITSTSNTAVDNVIKEFKIIFNGKNNFFFIGGKKDNIEDSKNRILNYIEELENSLSFNKDNQLKYEQNIKDILNQISKKQKVFTDIEDYKKKHSNYNKNTKELIKERDKLKQIPILENKVKELMNGFEELKMEKAELIKNYNRQIKNKSAFTKIEKEFAHIFNMNKQFNKSINTIIEDHFLSDFINIRYLINNPNILDKMLNLFFDKKQEIINSVLNKYPEYTKHITIMINKENIESIIEKSENLLNKYNNDIRNLDINDNIEEQIASFKNKEKIKKDELNQIKFNLIKLKEQKKELKTKLEENKKEKITLANQKKKLNSTIVNKYKFFTNYLREELHNLNRDLYDQSILYLEELTYKESKKVIYYLRLWISLLNGEKSSEEKKFINFEEFYQNISLAYPIITSTLASASNNIKTGMHNKKDIKPYSLCLSDESGMIAPHSLLPALFRSEKAIIVGDPKQLEPIVSLSNNNKNELMLSIERKSDFNKYSPTETTAFHRAAFALTGDYMDLGNGIMLDEHRRCHKDIAELFKEIGGYPDLLVKTEPIPEKELSRFDVFDGKHLVFSDIIANYDEIENTSVAEVKEISRLLPILEKQGFDLNKVGIITPFQNQEKLLVESFKDILNHSYGNEKIGTIHKFQGTEFDVIIFSTVISKYNKKASFINQKPNLLNVAISRAKQLFIQVGSKEFIEDAGGYLGIIMRHMEINGYFLKKEREKSLKNK
jgi:hypothetical protein